MPDDAISPGELHVELLKLNWHDLFTTNYDTLLERAHLDAGVSYNVVTNKDKKLNQKSQQRIYALLNRLAEKIPDCNLDYEYVTDFNYFTLMLAGAMKSQYGAKPATDKWEEIYNDEKQFNDVKRGFEKGLSLQ